MITNLHEEMFDFVVYLKLLIKTDDSLFKCGFKVKVKLSVLKSI